MVDFKIMFLTSLACLTFAEWSGVIDKFKYWLTWERRLKPFDCAMCLTLWVSLAIFIHQGYGAWSTLYAFANSGLTILINKAYERISAK